MLDLQDIKVPTELYNECIKSKKEDESSLKTEKDLNRNKKIIQFLENDLKDQKKDFEGIRQFLKVKLSSFFESI